MDELSAIEVGFLLAVYVTPVFLVFAVMMAIAAHIQRRKERREMRQRWEDEHAAPFRNRKL